jgi:hypothetical protein
LSAGALAAGLAAAGALAAGAFFSAALAGISEVVSLRECLIEAKQKSKYCHKF